MNIDFTRTQARMWAFLIVLWWYLEWDGFYRSCVRMQPCYVNVRPSLSARAGHCLIVGYTLMPSFYYFFFAKHLIIMVSVDLKFYIIDLSRAEASVQLSCFHFADLDVMLHQATPFEYLTDASRDCGRDHAHWIHLVIFVKKWARSWGLTVGRRAQQYLFIGNNHVSEPVLCRYYILD